MSDETECNEILRVLSEAALWQGVAIGLNSRIRLTGKLALEGDAAASAYAVAGRPNVSLGGRSGWQG
ncbi:hypothetical protein [Aquabacter cavernae]|uniref:hypothetical protein n=1 Tax=Aquabacter cavernae TaxID=2496029 RepID=UPI000F8E39C5|nr:hypothetical protein [Aquabacter cavernae]